MIDDIRRDSQGYTRIASPMRARSLVLQLALLLSAADGFQHLRLRPGPVLTMPGLSKHDICMKKSKTRGYELSDELREWGAHAEGVARGGMRMLRE